MSDSERQNPGEDAAPAGAAPGHVPVLVREVLEVLAPGPGEVYVDCTAGLGGHAALVAPRLASGPAPGPGPGMPPGVVVLNDADAGNLERAAARVRAALGGAAGGAGVRVFTLHGNYAEVPARLMELGARQGLDLRAHAVLADLGFSSNQVEDGGRGFSFQRDGPLDMRLDTSRGVTAAELVAGSSERELERILREFGEEPGAGRIARKIVREREVGPILTTARLAAVVRSAIAARPDRRGIDPATRTFQALRIAVNDELGGLDALLSAVDRGARRARDEWGGSAGADMEGWLRVGARVGLIAFHSLEDRPIKRAFSDLQRAGVALPLTDGVVTPTEEEVSANPRARSARLRAVRVVGRGG